MKLLTEKFAYQGGAVDRTGARPVIRGVLLCGPTSANRRRYRREAFADGRVKKYDGRPVFFNHGDGQSGRRYQDRIGFVRNPRLRADGMPVGDIEINHMHPHAEQLLEDAANAPSSIGMSHVAHCSTSVGRDGWEDVNAVEEVESVDVVLDPATTKGMYESANRRSTVKTIRAYVAEMFGSSRPKVSRAAKRLHEAIGAGTLAAPMIDGVPSLDGSDDHQQAVDAAMDSAGAAVWASFVKGALTLDAALEKLEKLGKAHAKIKQDDEPDDGLEAVESRSRWYEGDRVSEGGTGAPFSWQD